MFLTLNRQHLLPLAVISLLMLGGCASQQPFDEPLYPEDSADSQGSAKTPHKQASQQRSIPQAPKLSDWDQYQQVLQRIDRWQVQGKLGIRLPSDSGSVYFNWQQRPQDYAIHLSGPLGQGASWIRGNPKQVSLERGNQPPAYADNLETLMYSTLGWSLPVSELYYWVRGIPSPNASISHISHDDSGRLQTLQQQGWQLRFERYREVESWALPGKLIAERDDLRLTFIIKNWTLR